MEFCWDWLRSQNLKLYSHPKLSLLVQIHYVLTGIDNNEMQELLIYLIVIAICNSPIFFLGPLYYVCANSIWKVQHIENSML